MNFGYTILILFALAKSADAQAGDRSPKLRGLGTSIDMDLTVGTYNEKLGQCRGAICGLWGDPHIISCDGLGFDCNAEGLFTLMKNFLYNIQGRFVHVNSIAMGMILEWNNYPTATYTNDIIIQNVDNPDVPLMQFSFPNFHSEEDMAPSERGCLVDFRYNKDMEGYGRTTVDTIVDCRERCEGVEGCTKFSYSQDGGCHLADDEAKLKKAPRKWSRTVAGPVHKCGHEQNYEDIMEGTEYLKARTVGNGYGNNSGEKKGPGCPVLYYEDKVLKDISDLEDNGYLYGGPYTKNYARLDGFNKIKVVHTTAHGSLSEIMLEVGGDGPGELWSCHWNMFVCLPETEQESFEKTLFEGEGVGLFGSPDGNSQNDWTDFDGGHINIPKTTEKAKGVKGKSAYNYCKNNWCVSQKDSIMAYPENSSYDDIKCYDEEYIPFDLDKVDCAISKEKIIEACANKPVLLVHSCQVDCCEGGCGTIDHEIDEIQKIKKLSDEDKDIVYDFDVNQEVALCNGDFHDATGETACPSSSRSQVKVIHKTADIPDGEPIIYGISFADAKDDDHGREVSFRLDNPFENKADAYVRYEKRVGLYANDPACESMPDLVPGCDVDAKEITVGCIEYPGIEPFALVDVYFASTDPFVVGNADGITEVEKCCKPPDYSGVGIIKYSFKIQCSCPGDESAV